MMNGLVSVTGVDSLCLGNCATQVVSALSEIGRNLYGDANFVVSRDPNEWRWTLFACASQWLDMAGEDHTRHYGLAVQVATDSSGNVWRFEVQHGRPLRYRLPFESSDGLLTTFHRNYDVPSLVARRIYDPDHVEYFTATSKLSFSELRSALAAAVVFGLCLVSWQELY